MRLGLAIAVVVALADQASKAWVLKFFDQHPGAPLAPVTSYFNLVLTMNRGMSFGLFSSGAINALIFALVAAAIVAALLAWLARTGDPLLRSAIGLVIGGAVGNVADRLVRGAVVDFLDFHLGALHWFAFNLADAAISVGVALMVIDGLRSRREARN
ncbi:MAG TPA: signal peptidase II [Stellaceae bacterium]|nr:signal peptidase II [Stellaceae bacterium]